MGWRQPISAVFTTIFVLSENDERNFILANLIAWQTLISLP